MKKEAAVYIMAKLATEIGMKSFNDVVQEIVEMDNQIQDEKSEQTILERSVMYMRLNQEALETANQLP
jgi:hypothetical protein